MFETSRWLSHFTLLTSKLNEAKVQLQVLYFDNNLAYHICFYSILVITCATEHCFINTNHVLAGFKRSGTIKFAFCDGMRAELLFPRIKMIVELKMLNKNITNCTG